MELNNFKKLTAALMVLTLWTMPVMAHEEKGPHDEMQEAKEMEKSGNVSDILKEIKEHEEHLQMLIQNGQLDQVHEVAFMIRDLSKALQEKAQGFSSADTDKIKLTVDEISKAADQLDEAGDAGDKAKTEEHFVHLQQLLKSLEDSFPKGTLG